MINIDFGNIDEEIIYDLFKVEGNEADALNVFVNKKVQ